MTSTELARRWLASKHWGGWRVGMKSWCGRLFVEERDEGEAFWVWCADDGCESLSIEIMAPDLDHPGTRAFLLGDVQKAWGCCVVIYPPCTLRPRLWSCEVEQVDSGVVYWQRFQARTEAAALIAALEAAPGE